MDGSGTTRVTVEEAARLLGIEKQSVKKRIQRGKLRSERDARGAVWVELDESETVRDTSETGRETVRDDRDELVEELRDRVAFLERSLERRGVEAERYQQIVAGLSQTNARLSDRVLELEAPADQPATSQPSETASQDAAEDAGGPAAPAGETVAQNATTSVAKPSRQVVAETVTAGLILAGALAVAKVLIPAIAAIAAFVFAGVTAINGESVASAISSILGFLSVIVGYWSFRASQRRLRKATIPFECGFSEDSWDERERDGETEFTLEIQKSEHGKGDNPTATVYESSRGGYAEVGTAVEVDPLGTVVIGSGMRFTGKVLVR